MVSSEEATKSGCLLQQIADRFRPASVESVEMVATPPGRRLDRLTQSQQAPLYLVHAHSRRRLRRVEKIDVLKQSVATLAEPGMDRLYVCRRCRPDD